MWNVGSNFYFESKIFEIYKIFPMDKLFGIIYVGLRNNDVRLVKFPMDYIRNWSSTGVKQPIDLISKSQCIVVYSGVPLTQNIIVGSSSFIKFSLPKLPDILYCH